MKAARKICKELKLSVKSIYCGEKCFDGWVRDEWHTVLFIDGMGVLGHMMGMGNAYRSEKTGKPVAPKIEQFLESILLESREIVQGIAFEKWCDDSERSPNKKSREIYTDCLTTGSKIRSHFSKKDIERLESAL